MKAEFLNPFLKSIVQIIESTLSESPNKGDVFLRDKYPYDSGNVALIVGITGILTGQVIISMADDTAKKVAARMLMEESVDELDEYAQSALGEIANMITANATIGLSDAGYDCDITPPSVITGKGIEISCQVQIRTVVIPLKTSMGDIEVNLGVIETAALKGAAAEKASSTAG